jgi:hypothetical protein
VTELETTESNGVTVEEDEDFAGQLGEKGRIHVRLHGLGLAEPAISQVDVEVRIVRKGMLDSDDRVVEQLMLAGVPVTPGASQDLLLEWDGRVSTNIMVTLSATDRQLTDSSGSQPPGEIFKPDPELLPDHYLFPGLRRIIVKETGAGNVLFDKLVSGARFSVPRINYLNFTVDWDGVSGPSGGGT